MNILVVHPEDSATVGPWAGQKWDLVIDLGRSSEFARTAWESHLNAPVLPLQSLWRGSEDFVLMRQTLIAGRDRLIDKTGLDWWELTSVFIYTALEESLLLIRLAAQLKGDADVFATRSAWPATGVGFLLERPLPTFQGAPAASPLHHYGGVLKKFSFDQLAQIFFDKYDPRYRWRTRFASARRASHDPIVLLPSAYTNVSRMAVAYAGMLPEQSFLLVATRRSGTHFDPLPNVACASLAAYADRAEPRDEFTALLKQWNELKETLACSPEMKLLLQAGLLDRFSNHFRDGLAVRNAWRNVLSREPVAAVMCGDDSNPFTRLPVLLARRQGVPTLDFHHGALDGRFLIKQLSSDLYLAKGEMERDYLVRTCGLPEDRVVVAGPPRSRRFAGREDKSEEKSQITFFSEPYENGGWRTEEIYREILPALVRVARDSGRRLAVKLHPFESRSERRRLIEKVLGREDALNVDVFEGPLTAQLFARTWFAITVESTTVIDCSLLGIPCFVCEWLSVSPYEYARQYARFKVGKNLTSPEQLNHLVQILEEPETPLSKDCLSKPMDPDWLRAIIATGTCTVNRPLRQIV